MDADLDPSARPPHQVGDAGTDLRATHDSTLELRGRLSGGLQGGSWLLESESGSRRVLKVTDDASLLARREETIGLVDRLVHRGYPTPPWLHTGLTCHGVGYLLTPYVEGTTPTWSTLDLPRLIDACGAGTRALDYAWLYRDGATSALPMASLARIRRAGEAVVGADAFRFPVVGACCELLAFQTRHSPGHMIPAHSQDLLDCMASLR